MPRYFVPITPQNLNDNIWALARKSTFYTNDGYFSKKWALDGEEIEKKYTEYYMSSALELLDDTQIHKDLSKIIFDQENCDADEDERTQDGTIYDLVGYHTLDNKLTFLGVVAGGDWESPLFYIIYWDGKKLRGYIPTEGNPWNKETKTAYGSEMERGEQYDDYWDKDPQPVIPAGDPQAILNDIRERIHLKE